MKRIPERWRVVGIGLVVMAGLSFLAAAQLVAPGRIDLWLPYAGFMMFAPFLSLSTWICVPFLLAHPVYPHRATALVTVFGFILWVMFSIHWIGANYQGP